MGIKSLKEFKKQKEQAKGLMVDDTGEGAKAYVASSGPYNPAPGAIWYDTSASELKIFVGSEWVITGSGSSLPSPTIATVSPASYGGDISTTFTITGTYFDLGTVVDFIDANGIAHRASSTTVVSQIELTAVTPKAFLASDGPLDIKVTRTDSLTATYQDAVQTGTAPGWNTPSGTLYVNAWPDDVSAGDNSYRLEMNVNESISATDPEGQTITYSIESGSLPPNVTLNTSTGAITGTLPTSIGSDTTYSFVAGAEDTAGNKVTRAFAIIVKNETTSTPGEGLYDFTSVSSVPSGMIQVSVNPIVSWGSSLGVAMTASGADVNDQASYPLRVNATFNGDFLFQLSTRIDADPGGSNYCSDASIGLFNTNTSSTWTWKWGALAGRISAQNNCASPYIYGYSGNTSQSNALQLSGVWVTMHMYHEPSLGRTRYLITRAQNDWALGGTNITNITLNESFTGDYWVGLSSDDDSDNMYMSAFNVTAL